MSSSSKKQNPKACTKHPRLARTTSVELDQRSLSALTRHQRQKLSDIREVSVSSNAGPMNVEASETLDGVKDSRNEVLSENPIAQSITPQSPHDEPTKAPAPPVGSSKNLGDRTSSVWSLPIWEVPERKSSASILAQSLAGSRHSSLHEFPSQKALNTSASGKIVSPRGRSDSPVRQALSRDAVSSDRLRASPSRTFVRTTPPLDILDQPSSSHDRVEMRVRIPSPLFVGGGTIEGQIHLVVDGEIKCKSKPKPILISKLSVDVIGVEEISDGKRWIFLSLATELIDKSHPPPASLVCSQLPAETSVEGWWLLKPASATLPFCLNLPLKLGPPPYLSKQASIRYLLCPTAVVKLGRKIGVIRQTWNIQMLTVHDPEKALASLPSPLLAADSLCLAHFGEGQHIRLTAGLHRQVWVNGGRIFVDIHVANNSSKIIKKIEVQLEKTLLWYTHAAAGTVEKSASHLRLPRKSDSEVIKTTAIKKSKEWSGVPPFSSEVRTCEIPVPYGHVTISTGRYFEVRYFLNVHVSVNLFKGVAVQLPVTIIHINSLDILPNALAQVAASIEAKRSKTVPTSHYGPCYVPFHQGQAFTAPRRQSLERSRSHKRRDLFKDEISTLTADLDNSPRRFSEHHPPRCAGGKGLFSHENLPPAQRSGMTACHHHHMNEPSCYHCHLILDAHSSNSTVDPPPGLKLPRLQLSTSGLGFSDSEFEVSPETPRKVMLSERERKMINQQRDLDLQRKFSQRKRRASDVGVRDTSRINHLQDGYWSWTNVAASPRDIRQMSDRPKRISALTHMVEGKLGRDIKVNPAGPDGVRPKPNRPRVATVPGSTRHGRNARSMDPLTRVPTFPETEKAWRDSNPRKAIRPLPGMSQR